MLIQRTVVCFECRSVEPSLTDYARHRGGVRRSGDLL